MNLTRVAPASPNSCSATSFNGTVDSKPRHYPHTFRNIRRMLNTAFLSSYNKFFIWIIFSRIFPPNNAESCEQKQTKKQVGSCGSQQVHDNAFMHECRTGRCKTNGIEMLVATTQQGEYGFHMALLLTDHFLEEGAWTHVSVGTRLADVSMRQTGCCWGLPISFLFMSILSLIFFLTYTLMLQQTATGCSTSFVLCEPHLRVVFSFKVSTLGGLPQRKRERRKCHPFFYRDRVKLRVCTRFTLCFQDSISIRAANEKINKLPSVAAISLLQWWHHFF